MWKESYRTGIDAVDQQHQELFRVTELLVKTVHDNADWSLQIAGCQKTLTFLQEYVIMHFQMEEAYQESIQYAGRVEHARLHRQFTQEVLDYKQRLLNSHFDRTLMKQFAGMLASWLIFHVADADQRYAKNIEAFSLADHTLLHSFLASITDTLEKMAGVSCPAIQTHPLPLGAALGDVAITVQLVGDLQGSIVYGFPSPLH